MCKIKKGTKGPFRNSCTVVYKSRRLAVRFAVGRALS
jgi:hypothetical protein